MRTHKKYGLLLAGINGHKIYFKEGQYLVVGRYGFKKFELEKETRTVNRYVNLQYYPVLERQEIRDEFLNLIEGLL